MNKEQEWLAYVVKLRNKHDEELHKLREDHRTEMQTAVQLLQSWVHDHCPLNETINFVQAYWNKHNIFPYEP
jgi:hypothetical protein